MSDTRNKFAALLALCAALAACNSTRPLATDADTVEEISRKTVTDGAVIILNDSSSLTGYRVAIRTDSTEWYSEHGDTMTIVATDFIHSISIATPHVALGLFRGLGSGIIVGAFTGVYLALADTSGNGVNNAGDFSLVGAVIGGIVGLIAGPILEADDRTVFTTGGESSGW